MLQTMRDNAGSWIIKVLLGLIALAFGLSFGVYNYGQQSKQVALTVNGEDILENQIREEQSNLAERYRAQFGDQFNKIAGMLKLREQAEKAVVDRVLLFQAAESIGVSVSNSELNAYIRSLDAFKINGVFNKAAYVRVLQRNRMMPEDFEAMQRGQMIMDKLSALVAGSAQVTPLEVDGILKTQLARVKAAYRVFETDSFKDKVEVSPDEIEKFYRENIRNYQNPATVRLKYITFPLADYRDQVKVLKEDVEEAYELDRGKYFKPERVHARHILIRLPENALEAESKEAEKKAREILALAKKEGADFVELAKEHSQGPTAATGGDLGWFTRGRMVPEFDQMAFKLGKGGMDVVRTQFGWHVIKVEDHQKAETVPLEKVAPEIKQALEERQARDLASAAAERAFDLAATGTAMADVAKEFKRGVEETEDFIPGAEVPGLSGMSGLKEALEGLDQGQVLQPMGYRAGSVLAYLDKRTPAHAKPLKEVEEDVKLSLINRKATKAAEEAAAGLIKELAPKAKGAVKALADSQGAATSDWLKITDPIKEVEASQALVRGLFYLTPEAPVLDKPVAVGKGYAVAALAGRRQPTQEEMDKERDSFRLRLLAAKRREMVQRFMTDLHSRAEISRPADGNPG